MLLVHAVVVLALPAVEAFDLAIPAQVFADPGLPKRYEFIVCAPAAGLVRSTTGFSVQAERGLEALAVADTVVVPGYLPLGDPGERVCSALRQAAARGARMVSVCTGAFALAALTVTALARHAGWAPRTLARHFIAETGLAPMRWLAAARIREARRLLEATDLPVEAIAARCGLGTAANLRLRLARDAGATPTAYRAAYQGRPPGYEAGA
jgi:transcriptional regulator GlxA family with amidase domain